MASSLCLLLSAAGPASLASGIGPLPPEGWHFSQGELAAALALDPAPARALDLYWACPKRRQSDWEIKIISWRLVKSKLAAAPFGGCPIGGKPPNYRSTMVFVHAVRATFCTCHCATVLLVCIGTEAHVPYRSKGLTQIVCLACW